jgi:hypothetical protein
MPEPVKPGPSEAAEYVLGLLGKEDRHAFAQRLGSDAALQAQVAYWEDTFSSLPAAEAAPMPAGMFEKILGRIEGEGADLPGTRTDRAGAANWFEISPGIKGRLLHVDRAARRQHLLIRMSPGSSYHPHSHDAEEHTLVLEGDIAFGELHLKAGDFHVATPSSSHPPGRTVHGCLVHVIMGIDQH